MILTDISSPAGVDLSLIVQLKTTNNSLEHSVVVIYGPLKVTEEPTAWCGWEQRRFGKGNVGHGESAVSMTFMSDL